LYGIGDCSVLNDAVSIGMVGTRNASVYGIETAQKLSFLLALSGATIVSGGALGVDSEAHAGAMLAKGRTLAFLGCGLSVNYLMENAPLRRAITRYGAVVSEYSPLTPASRTTFPTRNRLISGVSLGIVVVEAGVKSGSLITANFALDQGKDVFAVPGDIVRSSFDGTNYLIKNGAKPVFTAEDILSEYEYRYGDLLDLSNAKVNIASVPYVDYRKKKSTTQSKYISKKVGNSC
jgi:DNA processing protein